MFDSKSLLSSACLALALSSCSVARPSLGPYRHSTRGVHSVGRRGLEVETYHPEPTFETFGSLGRRLAKRSSLGASLEARARSFLETRLNVTRTGLEYRSGFSLDGVEHAYLSQTHDGIPFINAVANVAFSESDDFVLSFGSSFVKPYKVALSKPTADLGEAIATAEDVLDAKYNRNIRLAYLVRPDHSAVLVYAIEVQNHEDNAHYEAFYRAVPIQRASFAEGTELLVHPEDLVASPYGWNENRTMWSGSTIGNNAVAHTGTSLLDATDHTAEDADLNLTFDYQYDASLPATDLNNLDAARVNVWYVGNVVHDFAWKYGFRPLTFNFQADTIQDKWARGDDPVLIRVQTTPGVNDAVFTTPPDGQSGVLKLYVWNKSNPTRDVSMANDVLVHELTHGITNRLTGGGTAACLQTLEARALGEGWSNAMAEWTEQDSATISDYVIGAWINNNPAGLRVYPYSTDPAINHLRYSSLATSTTIYQFGEVWANILHNVYAALVQAHGWSSTAFTDPDTAHGNVVFMRLFFDALSFQPCNPTFVSARDAWIQADETRYAGTHKCLLWTAFASRGLGVNAANFVEDTSVPAGC